MRRARLHHGAEGMARLGAMTRNTPLPSPTSSHGGGIPRDARPDAPHARGAALVGSQDIATLVANATRAFARLPEEIVRLGHVFEDAMALKYAHQRYFAYLSWLEWSGR